MLLQLLLLKMAINYLRQQKLIIDVTHNFEVYASLLITLLLTVWTLIQKQVKDLTGQYKTRTADHGLRTGYKIWNRYKTRTTD